MIILNGYLYMYVNLIVCMYGHPSFCMCDTLQKKKKQPQIKEKQNKIKNKNNN